MFLQYFRSAFIFGNTVAKISYKCSFIWGTENICVNFMLLLRYECMHPFQESVSLKTLNVLAVFIHNRMPGGVRCFFLKFQSGKRKESTPACTSPPRPPGYYGSPVPTFNETKLLPNIGPSEAVYLWSEETWTWKEKKQESINFKNCRVFINRDCCLGL